MVLPLIRRGEIPGRVFVQYETVQCCPLSVGSKGRLCMLGGNITQRCSKRLFPFYFL